VLRMPNKRRAGEERRSFASAIRTLPRVEKWTQKMDDGRECLALTLEAHASTKKNTNTHTHTHTEQRQLPQCVTQRRENPDGETRAPTQRIQKRGEGCGPLLADCATKPAAQPAVQLPVELHNSLPGLSAWLRLEPSLLPSWAPTRVLDETGCDMGGQKPPKRNR
jgi:hypothetical protein